MDAITWTSTFPQAAQRRSIALPILVLAVLCLLSVLAGLSDPEGFAEILSHT